MRKAFAVLVLAGLTFSLLHEMDDLKKAYDYWLQDIRYFSPYMHGIPEFRNGDKDRDIARRIRKDHPLLAETGYSISRELDMTKDNDLFTRDRVGIPLYEGKTIHQYNSSFSEPEIWVPEQEARNRLLGKEINRIKRFLRRNGSDQGLSGKKLKEYVQFHAEAAKKRFEAGEFVLDYEVPRLVYRAIASSTNERTLISTIIKPKAFLAHSLYYFKPLRCAIDENGDLVQVPLEADDALFLLALLNSFVLDFYIRFRVSANVTPCFVYELPIPTPEHDLKCRISKIASRLVNTEPVPLSQAWKEQRAEIEVLIAKDIYHLDREEMLYILKTFTYGEPDKELMELILENY